MDSLDNSKNPQSRSLIERLDRLEEIFRQLTPDRQKAMMEMLSTGTLAEDLRKAITDSGLTTYAIGKACKISPILINRFMSGERDMRVATASKICEVLGYGLAKLEKPKNEPETGSTKPGKKTAKKPTKKKPSK